MGMELAKAYIRVQADSSGLRSDFSGIQQDVESSLQGAKKAALGIFGVFAGGMAGILRSGLMAAGQFEQTTISFETMLGSAKETQEILNKLTVFAAKTPFEMPEITQAARGLIQFGERGEELMDTLDLLGNAAAGSSTPFSFLALVFNQVRGVGKLLTQDFRQLSTRGILSMQDIADHFGVSLEEAEKKISSGAVKFEDLRKILKKLSSEGGRFYKLMERQSTSLLGLSSTLSDAWNILARVLATSLMPAAKALQGIIISAVETIQMFVEYTDGMAGSTLAGAVAFSVLGASILGAGLAAKFFGMTLKGALVGSGVGVLFVVLGAVAGMLIDRFDVLEKGTKLLGDAIDGMKEPLMDLLEWMKVVWINMDGIWAQSGLIAQAGLAYLGDVIRNSGPFLMQALGYALGQLFGVVQQVLQAWVAAFTAAFSRIGDVINYGVLAIGNMVTSGLGMILGVFESTGDFILSIWSGIFPTLWNVTGQGIGVVQQLIADLVNSIVSHFSQMSSWVNFSLSDMWKLAIDNLIGAWGDINGFIGNTLLSIVDKISNFGTTIQTMWGDIWTSLAGIAKAAWDGGRDAVVALMTGMMDKIKEAASSFAAGFAGVAPDVQDLFKPSPGTQQAWDKITVDDKMKREKDLMESARKKEGPKTTAPAVTEKPKSSESVLKAGRYSLPEFGNKLQDTLFKKDDGMQLDKDRNGLLESSLKKQDEIIGAIKGITGTAATLTGGND